MSSWKRLINLEAGHAKTQALVGNALGEAYKILVTMSEDARQALAKAVEEKRLDKD